MPPRSVPTEILTLIFRNLSLQDLYRCLFVSHRWHDPAEAQLYSDVTLNALQKTYKPLITALKTRRHLLRSIRWWFARGCELLEPDFLAILSDNRPVSNTHEEGGQDQRPGKHVLQTGRPGLREFSFVGDGRSERLLELVMSNLTTTALKMTTLTTLTLHFACGIEAETYIVDLDRILATFPYLKDLSIDGWMHAYAPAAAKGMVAGTESQYRLESLTFDPRLMGREGPDAFLFFKRLGNLRRIQVKSLLSPYDCFRRSRPWAFGRALKEHCPKLESVDTSGSVALWLYDLPVLWPSKMPQIISLEGQLDTSVQKSDETSRGGACGCGTFEAKTAGAGVQRVVGGQGGSTVLPAVEEVDHRGRPFLFVPGSDLPRRSSIAPYTLGDLSPASPPQLYMGYVREGLSSCRLYDHRHREYNGRCAG